MAAGRNRTPNATGLPANDSKGGHPVHASLRLAQRQDDFLHSRLALGSLHHGGVDFPSPEVLSHLLRKSCETSQPDRRRRSNVHEWQ